MDKNLSERLAEAKGAPIIFGDVEVRAIHELRLTDERFLSVTFESWSHLRPQALRMQTEGAELIVNGLTLEDATFWTDTAPRSFKVTIRPTRKSGTLKMWNEWKDESGVVHAWIGNAGITVSDEGDGILLRCSDGLGDPKFDDLIVKLRSDVEKRVVDFASHRAKRHI